MRLRAAPTAAILAAATLLAIVGTVDAAARYPVIGCNARGAEPGGAARAYAPASCDLSSVGPGGQGYGSESTLFSFSRVRWSHWGAKTATGRGVQVYCNDGCWTSKVRLTVYRLQRHIDGTEESDYSRLRLVEPRQVVFVIGRESHPIRVTEPGYREIFNVTPSWSGGSR